MSRKNPKKQSVYQKFIKSKTFHWIDFYGTPLFIMILPLFFIFKSYDITKNELKNIDVTVSQKPEFIRDKVKTTTYEYYIIRTLDFKKDFRINGLTYDSTNPDLLKDIKSNDKVTLKILKSDFKELNDETYWNNYNNIYDLIKNEKSYINLELRSELKSKDMRWLFPISLIGLIMLIYSFIKKPKLKMKRVIYISCSVLIVILYLYN
jgi:hypothetical protein